MINLSKSDAKFFSLLNSSTSVFIVAKSFVLQKNVNLPLLLYINQFLLYNLLNPAQILHYL